MTLTEAITKVVALTGGDQTKVPAIVEIFRKAGVDNEVPERVVNRVLAAGKALKAIGVR